MMMKMRWVLVVRECSVLVSKRVESAMWISIGMSDGAAMVLFSIEMVDREL